jgi:uncharacterized protein YprB with RNaseH-like and TPR domain
MTLAATTEHSLLPFPDLIPAFPDQSRMGRHRRHRRSVDPNFLASLKEDRCVLFLDVETTGLSRHYDEITLVGWLSDGVYRVYVAGDDPEPLLSSLRQASALVTFNGTLFDLAFLAKSFPGSHYRRPMRIVLGSSAAKRRSKGNLEYRSVRVSKT